MIRSIIWCLLAAAVMVALAICVCRQRVEIIKLEKNLDWEKEFHRLWMEKAEGLVDEYETIPTTGWHALNGGPCRCPPGRCPFEENREFQFFPTNPPQVISGAMYDKNRGVKWGDGYLYPLKKRSAQ